MGGTFDPIHLGHLKAAERALSHFDLDEVVFVTAFCPPHKSVEDLAPAEDRFAMVELATGEYPNFSSSRIEVARQCPVYAGDTIEAFRDICDDSSRIYFITGLDAILTLINWDKARTYPGLTKFIAVSRPGYDTGQIRGRIPEVFKSSVEFLEDPGFDISSTEIRSRIQTHQSVDSMLPSAVREYIVHNKLYHVEEKG